jgi:hypothetical protein
MRIAPQLLRTVLVAALLLSLTGCSYRYNFDLTVIVRNAADGQPMSGARVTPEPDFFHTPRTDKPRGEATDADGRIAYPFSVSIGEFDEGRRDAPWKMKVEREGFAPEVVDVKPKNKPEKYGSTTPLVVQVYLRPQP